jgi:hypothetical protein
MPDIRLELNERVCIVVKNFLLNFIAVLLSSSIGIAQQSTQTSPPTKRSEQEKRIERKEQSQRILGVVPEFGVTDRKDAPPLTPKMKFRLFYKSAFDPMEFALVGLQAGISQAQNSFPSYGQGAAGYGKRYGAAFADQVSSGFFTNFFYPTLLKEDPRYFRLGEGSFRHRIAYALSQEFITHKDKGGRTFNWPNTLGALSAGSISNAYYPSEDRGFGLTMSRAGISVLYGSLGGLASEFWPDVYKKLHHRPKPALVPGEKTQK